MESQRTDSVQAYDADNRVLAYDADMDVMHPLRSKMVAVALEVLPFDRRAELRGLDLGVGTGFFTARFLEFFPQASVVAVDGAEAMLSFCKARLGDLANRVEFVISDFQQLGRKQIPAAAFDVVFSAFALHHLTALEKQRLIENALGWLKPGGWFVNADLVVASDPTVERRVQQLRVEGVVARAKNGDQRFNTPSAARTFLDQLEAGEKDQPLSLLEDLSIAKQAGLAGRRVLESVSGGSLGWAKGGVIQLHWPARPALASPSKRPDQDRGP
jgi:ubiquinone/menaquinone biosynthesis C-methylase UbiE